MTESAPLLDNFDESAPHIGEAHTKKTSASAYFRPLLKILAITTLVISIVTMALLIAANIVVRQKNWGNSGTPWRGKAKYITKVLAILVCIPIPLSASLAFNHKNLDVGSPYQLWPQCSLHFPHLVQCRRRRRDIGMHYCDLGRVHTRDP